MDWACPRRRLDVCWEVYMVENRGCVTVKLPKNIMLQPSFENLQGIKCLNQRVHMEGTVDKRLMTGDLANINIGQVRPIGKVSIESAGERVSNLLHQVELVGKLLRHVNLNAIVSIDTIR